MSIKTHADFAEGCRRLGNIRRQLKLLQETKKEALAPVKAQLEDVDEGIKLLKKADLSQIEELVGFHDYVNDLRAKQLAEGKRVSPIAQGGGATFRYVEAFEVDDEDLVPREFCSPDMKKIEEAEGRDIPGVRKVVRTRLTFRGGKDEDL